MFERDVKNQILLDKLRNLITGSALGHRRRNPAASSRSSNTKVKFDYAVLRKDDICKGFIPTDAELKAFYERNKATYNNSIPEKRKIEYVLLDKRQDPGARCRSRPRNCRPTTISIATNTACPSR